MQLNDYAKAPPVPSDYNLIIRRKAKTQTLAASPHAGVDYSSQLRRDYIKQKQGIIYKNSQSIATVPSSIANSSAALLPQQSTLNSGRQKYSNSQHIRSNSNNFSCFSQDQSQQPNNNNLNHNNDRYLNFISSDNKRDLEVLDLICKKKMPSESAQQQQDHTAVSFKKKEQKYRSISVCSNIAEDQSSSPSFKFRLPGLSPNKNPEGSQITNQQQYATIQNNRSMNSRSLSKKDPITGSPMRASPDHQQKFQGIKSILIEKNFKQMRLNTILQKVREETQNTKLLSLLMHKNNIEEGKEPVTDITKCSKKYLKPIDFPFTGAGSRQKNEKTIPEQVYDSESIARQESLVVEPSASSKKATPAPGSQNRTSPFKRKNRKTDKSKNYAAISDSKSIQVQDDTQFSPWEISDERSAIQNHDSVNYYFSTLDYEEDSKGAIFQ